MQYICWCSHNLANIRNIAKNTDLANHSSKEGTKFSVFINSFFFRHPLVLPIEGFLYHPPHAYLQLQYCEGGTLKEWLEKQQRKEWEIQNIFQLVLQGITTPQSLLLVTPFYPTTFINSSLGIAHIHEKNCVHRDIKLDNILMASDTQPLISDFDICKNISTHTVTLDIQKGNIFYISSPNFQIMQKSHCQTIVTLHQSFNEFRTNARVLFILEIPKLYQIFHIFILFQ